MNLSLSSLALENEVRLKNFYLNLLSNNNDEATAITRFAEIVTKEGFVAINLTMTALHEVLGSGKYLNMFELGYQPEQIKRKYDGTGKYYDRLLTFLNQFDKERKIKYGHINLGNVGIPHPSFGGGKCTIWLKQDFTRSLDLTKSIYCLKKYSLLYYTYPDCLLLEDIENEISNFNNVNYLALYKYFKKSFPNELSEWKRMFVANSDCIEVLMITEIPINTFSRICLKKTFYNFLESINRRPEEELNEIDLFTKLQYSKIKDLCRNLNIELVVLNE